MARRPAKKQSWTSEQVAQLTKFANDHLPTRAIGDALASLGIGGKSAKRAKTKATAKRRTVKTSTARKQTGGRPSKARKKTSKRA